jgi:hypothetical protein
MMILPEEKKTKLPNPKKKLQKILFLVATLELKKMMPLRSAM